MTGEHEGDDPARTGAVRAELDRLGVTGEPQLEPLVHNRANDVTEGVWVVRAGGFEAVLKVLSSHASDNPQWRSSTVSHRWNYWRREAEVYATPLPAAYRDAGLRRPETLQVVDRGDGTVAVWMERVAGPSGRQLTEGTVAELSYRLGLAQGAWSRSAEPLPAWASRRFLRDYSSSRAVDWGAFADDAAWEHPLLAAFTSTTRQALRRLHREREWFLGVMEALPRTLAHLDVWPNNVIVAGDALVLVDWAFVGDGAIGEDVGNLLPDSVFDLFVPADRLAALTERAVDRYLDGLRAAGWPGSTEQARLGVWASAVKYDWLAAMMVGQAGHQQLDYGGAGPVDAGHRNRQRALALGELTGWARRARDLVAADPAMTGLG